MLIEETVLKELKNIIGTDDAQKNIDLDLFGEKVLDSLGTIELILALSQALGIEVTPGQIDRKLWATPRKIVDYLQERLKQ